MMVKTAVLWMEEVTEEAIKRPLPPLRGRGCSYWDGVLGGKS